MTNCSIVCHVLGRCSQLGSASQKSFGSNNVYWSIYDVTQISIFFATRHHSFIYRL